MKKSTLLLFAIFIFFYFLNIMTPMLNEDYSAVFVWPNGVPNLGELPEDVKRVSNFLDLFNNTKNYYLTEGGRVPGGIPGGTFSLLGKTFFNPVNAFVMIFLIMEIYWITHEGKITLNFNCSNIFWIFFCLWSFNPALVDSCLWMSGSSNYLWMIVVVLFFLIPYVQNYYNSNVLRNDSLHLDAGMFFLGVIAGWSHETTVCWIIINLGLWLFVCWRNRELQRWKLFGFIGLCIGYSLLIFAPGNFTRFHNASGQVGTGVVLIGHSLFLPKLVELVIILLFQFFLWHFVISFFFRYKKYFKSSNIDFSRYLIFAKVCLFVALCSMLIMFLIPVSGLRPSFLSLIFLILGTFTIFRVLEKAGIKFITGSAIYLLKVLGYSYLIITIAISLYGNVLNWRYWNEVLETIDDQKQILSHNVLEILPAPTDNNYLFWRFASGSHLIYVPVISVDENDRINKIVAKYNGIKGIKVTYKNRIDNE